MAVDAPVLRMLMGAAILLAIGIVGALARGDSTGSIAGYVLAVVVGTGVVLAGYVWSRRRK